MSLIRLVIWSSLIGGWSAFVGWLFLEILVGRWVAQYDSVAILMATLVAIPIGGGISLAYGLSNPKLEILLKRLLFGFAGGLLGGLLGTLFGSCIFSVFSLIKFLVFVGRTFGWALIGVGIGVGIGASEGLIDRSLKKMRNGLIGGVVGGFLGGLFFYPVSLIASDMSSRALSFVLLGLCVGLFIGLAQVILKETWLTVEQGFRAGRQIILGQDPITMGTSEKASLIFIAYGAKGVEPLHLKITKQPDGRYLLEDNQSRTGTLLNGTPISGPTALNDGDAIQLGVNVVRFNERVKHGDAPPPAAVVKLTTPMIPAPPQAIPAEAIQAKASAPVAKPSPPPAPPPAKAPTAPVAAKPPVPNMQIPPKPAPAPPQPQEGRCPICDKKVVGIPGERRCGKCFTTF